jgi:hypothetical protein
MWYEKYPGVPPRGSPLETVFLLVSLQRREAELLSQRTLLRGQLAILGKSTEAVKAAVESFEAYYDTLFPFMAEAADLDKQNDRAKLLEHVRYPMQINMGALRKELAGNAKAKASNKYKIKEK